MPASRRCACRRAPTRTPRWRTVCCGDGRTAPVSAAATRRRPPATAPLLTFWRKATCLPVRRPARAHDLPGRVTESRRKASGVDEPPGRAHGCALRQEVDHPQLAAVVRGVRLVDIRHVRAVGGRRRLGVRRSVGELAARRAGRVAHVQRTGLRVEQRHLRGLRGARRRGGVRPGRRSAGSNSQHRNLHQDPSSTEAPHHGCHRIQLCPSGPPLHRVAGGVLATHKRSTTKGLPPAQTA